MSIYGLKARVEQLEAKAEPGCKLPAVRIVQDGDLTQEQRATLVETEMTGQLVIIRQIIRHTFMH